MQRSLLIAGATGLVGTAVTELAAADGRFGRVITWGRRPVPGANARVEHWGPVEGELIKGLRPEPVDAVICCLGTTMRNVNGDKAAFIHVDQELVLALGRWASGGATTFCLVSAHGADAQSKFFYNRVKGEVENALREMDLGALHLFRPSILDGPRTENRPAERLGLAVMKLIAPALSAPMRPMPYRTLAAALLHAARTPASSVQVHSYKEILALAKEGGI